MIVLLGGNGFVGTAFQQCLAQQRQPFEVVTRKSVNYADHTRLAEYLKSVKADFLINAAGFTGRPNVDACELKKADCLAGNAVLPGTIRDVCDDLKLPWGHVSSGCIYTGTKDDGCGFTEQDTPNFSFRRNNCSFYSGSKALGEEILQGADRCFIWRLRIPFSSVDSPRNYISKMMRYERLLNARNSLSHLNEFAEACVACYSKQVEYGIYNVTNPGSVTTEQVVRMITKFGLTDKSFTFFESENEFMSVAAKTPRSNCVLDSSKAVAAGLPLTPVEEALERAMKEWTTAESTVAT